MQFSHSTGESFSFCAVALSLTVELLQIKNKNKQGTGFVSVYDCSIKVLQISFSSYNFCSTSLNPLFITLCFDIARTMELVLQKGNLH